MSETLPPRHPDDMRADQQIHAEYNSWVESCIGDRPEMPAESPADSLAQCLRHVYARDGDDVAEIQLSPLQRQRLGLDD